MVGISNIHELFFFTLNMLTSSRGPMSLLAAFRKGNGIRKKGNSKGSL